MFEKYKITLASASPRRKELLSGLDIQFTVEPSKDESEAYSDDLPWNKVPEFLARHKSDSFHRKLEGNEVLITADTLVFLENENGVMEIIGKPKDAKEAFSILRRLSDHTHKVLTGVCIRTNSDSRSFTASSDVTFGPLSPEEINYYIEKYKPFDKAGAYGIQEWIGHVAITNIDGSFYNIMGLPVQRVYRTLREMLGE
ncbi:MAG: septum formation protein Maf [Bacteroidales bacterium]|nr:septum formation protein Maf [Bacteroidales bacterium]